MNTTPIIIPKSRMIPLTDFRLILGIRKLMVTADHFSNDSITMAGILHFADKRLPDKFAVWWSRIVAIPYLYHVYAL